MRWTRLRCSSIVELVTDYLEGALKPAARRQFQRHLAGCSGCATYVAQMRSTIGLATRARRAG